MQQNNKTRFEVSGTRIRASQGHSLEGMPVTQEALEASWAVFDGEDSLWHGTQPDVVESIAREGLLRGARSHVHLAESRDSSVGKRANIGVLLEISPAKAARGQADAVQEPQRRDSLPSRAARVHRGRPSPYRASATECRRHAGSVRAFCLM